MNSNFDTLYNEFNGSISSANLADGAVTEAKVANDSIGTLNVKDGAVTPTKISTGALLLGYSSITSNFTTTSGTFTDVTGLSVSATVPSGGRTVEIVFRSRASSGAVSGNGYTYRILRDSTVIGDAVFTAPGANYSVPMTVIVKDTPSAGTYTYKVQCESSSGNFVTQATATSPAFILVKLV